MNVVVTCLLWFCLINLQGGDAATYTNGFPTRLVYGITFPSGPSTRLIPEMNFNCNSIITGYTAALRDRTGDLDPVIQVWRKNTSPPGSYYNTGVSIAINESLCVGGLRNISSEVFHCNLNQTTARVRVQPGDILGLELPKGDNDDIRLAFARVSRGPANYVYTRQALSSSSGAVIGHDDEVNWDLPQITFGSDSNCIGGFPDIPVSDVSGRTTSDGVTTLLIPEMNFMCNVSIIGFTVAGRSLNRGLHSKVQIWRRNSSQNSDMYYQAGSSISVHVPYSAVSGVVCMAAQRMVGNTFWCILHDNLKVSVQQGDILGLELPRTNNDEIFFTSGGPVNHVFEHQLNSNINYFLNGSYSRAQLPQILFNFTSDHCLNGFPDTVIFRGNSRRGELGRVTTRLFPELKFGCFGTIVGVSAAILDVARGTKPKIQIWRENETQSGLYHMMSSTDNLIRWGNNRCYRGTLSRGIYHCYALRENYRISVQPGDFLGLEIPPINKEDPEIYFKDGGPTNLVFQYPLGSTVDLSTDSYNITYDEPQITFLVLLDENAGSCPSDVLTTTPCIEAATAVPKHENNITTSNMYTPTSSPVESSNATTIVAGSVIGGIIAILLLIAVILLIVVLIHQRKQKQYTITSNGDAFQNPVYDGAAYNRALPTSSCKEPQTGNKDGTSTNYDHIKFDVKVNKEAVSLHTDDQTFSTMYESLETQYYEMTGPTLATHEEAYTYWEPANSVNDLHKQLSSNKYRELLRQQVKITKALSSGQFGVVSMGVWQSPTGAIEVAVKQLQPGMTEAEKIRFLQEAAINGQFRHPNVVQLMGVVTTGEPAMIVLELLSNGDLRNFLVKHQTPQKLESGGVDKHLLLQFCQHIASGMNYLASKAFVHRDLAARNILVSKDRICKISDFGMSRDLLDEDYYISHGGMIPVKWTAPEAIHYKKYSTASDVWSFGCVMYEIWSLGHKPFESYNNPEVIKMIEKGYRLHPPPGLSKELYKIMIQCWQPERSHRPTFPQLVELLSRADFELFLWEEEDLRNSDPRVKEIGAPLEIASGLYPELQRTYIGKQ